MPSVLRLPASHSQPVIMAGLGTGMAPFRAFIEERAFVKSQGEVVGPMILYFGSRIRANEWLYGSELEQYEREGLVKLRLAFSRDQKEKIYIQNRIEEDANLLNTLLSSEKSGHFYLCGPTWPVPDVEAAMKTGFRNGGGMTKEEADAYLETLKEEGRHVLEVY
jgi:sulfite reductase (NADPH) flavoprotein alpha-component